VRSFSGRLLGPVGDPIEGGYVDFEPDVRLVSDAAGQFVFESEPGVYEYEINTFDAVTNGRPLPSGWIGASVDLTTDDVATDLTLPFFDFDVRVLNVDGTPAGTDYGARVRGYSEFEAAPDVTLTGFWQSGTGAGADNLDSSGEMQLRGYATTTGEVTVQIYPPDAPTIFATATLTPNTTIEVVLPEVRSCWGGVLGAGGVGSAVAVAANSSAC
jgi:hypothetical protein